MKMWKLHFISYQPKINNKKSENNGTSVYEKASSSHRTHWIISSTFSLYTQKMSLIPRPSILSESNDFNNLILNSFSVLFNNSNKLSALSSLFEVFLTRLWTSLNYRGVEVSSSRVESSTFGLCKEMYIVCCRECHRISKTSFTIFIQFHISIVVFLISSFHLLDSTWFNNETLPHPQSTLLSFSVQFFQLVDGDPGDF